MSKQTQSMSDFLDDLWSNLDNSPAPRQPPGASAPPAQSQHPVAPAPLHPSQVQQDAGRPVQQPQAPQPVQARQQPAIDPRFVEPIPQPAQAQPAQAHAAPTQPVPQAPIRQARPTSRHHHQRLFYPKAPRSLKDAGISVDMTGRLILKLLAAQ